MNGIFDFDCFDSAKIKDKLSSSILSHYFGLDLPKFEGQADEFDNFSVFDDSRNDVFARVNATSMEIKRCKFTSTVIKTPNLSLVVSFRSDFNNVKDNGMDEERTGKTSPLLQEFLMLVSKEKKMMETDDNIANKFLCLRLFYLLLFGFHVNQEQIEILFQTSKIKQEIVTLLLFEKLLSVLKREQNSNNVNTERTDIGEEIETTLPQRVQSIVTRFEAVHPLFCKGFPESWRKSTVFSEGGEIDEIFHDIITLIIYFNPTYNESLIGKEIKAFKNKYDTVSNLCLQLFLERNNIKISDVWLRVNGMTPKLVLTINDGTQELGSSTSEDNFTFIPSFHTVVGYQMRFFLQKQKEQQTFDSSHLSGANHIHRIPLPFEAQNSAHLLTAQMVKEMWEIMLENNYFSPRSIREALAPRIQLFLYESLVPQSGSNRGKIRLDSNFVPESSLCFYLHGPAASGKSSFVLNFIPALSKVLNTYIDPSIDIHYVKQNLNKDIEEVDLELSLRPNNNDLSIMSIISTRHRSLSSKKAGLVVLGLEEVPPSSYSDSTSKKPDKLDISDTSMTTVIESSSFSYADFNSLPTELLTSQFNTSTEPSKLYPLVKTTSDISISTLDISCETRVLDGEAGFVSDSPSTYEKVDSKIAGVCLSEGLTLDQDETIDLLVARFMGLKSGSITSLSSEHIAKLKEQKRLGISNSPFLISIFTSNYPLASRNAYLLKQLQIFENIMEIEFMALNVEDRITFAINNLERSITADLISRKLILSPDIDVKVDFNLDFQDLAVYGKPLKEEGSVDMRSLFRVFKSFLYAIKLNIEEGVANRQINRDLRRLDVVIESYRNEKAASSSHSHRENFVQINLFLNYNHNDNSDAKNDTENNLQMTSDDGNGNLRTVNRKRKRSFSLDPHFQIRMKPLATTGATIYGLVDKTQGSMESNDLKLLSTFFTKFSESYSLDGHFSRLFIDLVEYTLCGVLSPAVILYKNKKISESFVKLMQVFMKEKYGNRKECEQPYYLLPTISVATTRIMKSLYDSPDVYNLRDEILNFRRLNKEALIIVNLICSTPECQMKVRELTEDSPSMLAFSSSRSALYKDNLLFLIQINETNSITPELASRAAVVLD